MSSVLCIGRGGGFLRAHRNLYMCARSLSAHELLVEIAKWGSTSACLEDLLKQLGVRPWSYGLFSNAGFAMSMLLLRNSGWELLGTEDNLHAYSQFKGVTGEDALDRESPSEVSSGSTFTLAEDYHFLTDRGTLWLREMELRKLLVGCLSARSSDVRQVYFLSINHDGFRLDWSIYGGDRMSGLPWPECFLNTSGEIIVISPESGEGLFLKGYLRQIAAWGPELTRRLSEWLPSLKSNQS